MNRILKAVFILFTFLLISSISVAGELRVVRVIDGNTLEAAIDHMKIPVRLVGIDAPEMGKKKNNPGQPFSKKAKKYLAGLVHKKTITIKEYGSDPNGRILGVVFVNGTNANLEMVKAGLAEVYHGKLPRYFNVNLYRDAEAEARSEKRGMWTQGDQYISPKKWREMHPNR